MEHARDNPSDCSSDCPSGCQLAAFMRELSVASGTPLRAHADLDAWAAGHWRDFWSFLVAWCRAPLSIGGNAHPACVGDMVEHSVFFPHLELNYADALLNLAVAGAESPALIACHADGTTSRWTRGELRERVSHLAAALREAGMKPGDRVAAVLRNDDQAVIVALAVAAVGATLASAAPDMGPDALRDRFSQVQPRWLVAHAREQAHDAGVPLPRKLAQLLAELPSVEFFIRVDGDGDSLGTIAAHKLTIASLLERGRARTFDWPKFGFNHPLFIMFSSGTTGPPKCMVHGAGGTLLEHVKEHRLHMDLACGDRMFFQTGCSWMMWNWQLSALASGVEIVANARPIASADTLWEIVARERVTVFGTSPPYLAMSQEAGIVPRGRHDFEALRAVLSTGSVLHDWQYRWVEENVKRVPLWSISGGTDIIGCFVLGSPLLPVVAGESACRSLGMDVRVHDGQLVCGNPFPSRPLGFLGDADGARFHAAYFAQNEGLWSHGDAAEATAHGGIRILGRLDGVLNVRGIKVSPGDIARVVLATPGVRDVLVVDQPWRGQSRVVALLVLASGAQLDAVLVARLRGELAGRLSTAHVPDVFAAVPELPVTHSGKTSESAARRALRGLPVENEAALRNPGCLAAIRGHPMLRESAAPNAADAASGSTLEQVRALWTELFAMPQPLQSRANFFELGGNSLLAAQMLARLGRTTGRALPVSALMEAPTIELLAAKLERAPSGDARMRRVFPARGGIGRPVFLVHGLSGTVMECQPLLGHLRSARPVYGFQARGIDDGLAPFERVEDIAQEYVRELRSVQPVGPYAIWGFSFGGLVALEMAQLLSAAGEAIEHVGLVDTYVVRSLRGAPALFDTAQRGLRIFHHLTWRQLGERLRARRRPPASLDLPPQLQRVHDAMTRALHAYRPRPFSAAPLVYLRADLPLGGYNDPLPAWQRVASRRLRILRVPGAHLDLVGPTSRDAAHAIDAVLAADAGNGSRPPVISLLDRLSV